MIQNGERFVSQGKEVRFAEICSKIESIFKVDEDDSCTHMLKNQSIATNQDSEDHLTWYKLKLLKNDTYINGCTVILIARQ